MAIVRLLLFAILAGLVSSADISALSWALGAEASGQEDIAAVGATPNDAEDAVAAGDLVGADSDDALSDDDVPLRLNDTDLQAARSDSDHRASLRESLGFADGLFRPPRCAA